VASATHDEQATRILEASQHVEQATCAANIEACTPHTGTVYPTIEAVEEHSTSTNPSYPLRWLQVQALYMYIPFFLKYKSELEDMNTPIQEIPNYYSPL
jgi:hypothetical protein